MHIQVAVEIKTHIAALRRNHLDIGIVHFVGDPAQRIIGHWVELHVNPRCARQDTERAMDFRRAIELPLPHGEAGHVVVDLKTAKFGFKYGF